MNGESIALVISLSSFFGGIILATWKTAARVSAMRSELQRTIATSDSDRRINDERHSCLQEKLELELHYLKEKFETFSSYSRREGRELNSRVKELEFHAHKTSDFQPSHD